MYEIDNDGALLTIYGHQSLEKNQEFIEKE